MKKIYAPASIGNVGVGFDILGAAISPVNKTFLGDFVTIKKSEKFLLTNEGTFAYQLPKNIYENIVWKCWYQFCKKIKKKVPMHIILEKNMPIGSGLGSSACSIVASLFGINKFCKNLLSNNQLLYLMGKLEGDVSGSIHYDNVAPCYLGGLQLIIDNKKFISQSIPNFKKWIWIIAWPGTKITTADARTLLPFNYQRKTCIEQNRYLASFIHASYTMQSHLAAASIQDLIAEPYRNKLLPDFIKIKQLIKETGGLACGISGSGPTIFAICDDNKIAEKIAECLTINYIHNKQGFVKICHLDTIGTRIIG